jgi:recombination protein RecR
MNEITLELINLIKSLPGVGKKQAERIVNFLLIKNKKLGFVLSKEIKAVLDKVKKCSDCHALTLDIKCEVCLKPNLPKVLMIVNSQIDLEKFLKINYLGYFYILEDNLSLDQISNNELLFNHINMQVNNKEIGEIILSLSPTIQGELNSSLLKSYFNNKVIISKLATGIPLGGNIEYVDDFTLSESLLNRKALK